MENEVFGAIGGEKSNRTGTLYDRVAFDNEKGTECVLRIQVEAIH